MRTMHLFAGAGGGLLADLILGHTPIIAVEWDSYACQVLRERSAEGWFPELQVREGDVRLFDPSEYAGRVDCIHSGFPCQDISVAGNQAGVGAETRSGLYREVLRIARVLRPRFLFLENVSAIVSNGLGTVVADLAALGYDVEWLCLRASDCGAPHHRDRWWCLAYSESNRCDSPPFSKNDGEEILWQRRCRFNNSSKNENVPNAERIGQQGSRKHEQSICSTEIGDRETDRIINGGQRNVGWWDAEPDVGRVANGVAFRIHRLKALGNGQVPLQAAVAWKLLGGP